MLAKQFVVLIFSFLILVTLAIWGLVLLRKNWGPRGVPLRESTVIFKITNTPGSYMIVYRTALGDEVRMRIKPDYLTVMDVTGFVSGGQIESLFQKVPLEVMESELQDAIDKSLIPNSSK